jgi:hypothetical protein
MDLRVGATRTVGPAPEDGGNNVLACFERGPDMNRTLAAAAAAVFAAGAIVTAAPAVAEPRCGFQGDWDCEGPPQYNGPLQNTWSHGWTSMPQICPGGADMQPCKFYVPEP